MINREDQVNVQTEADVSTLTRMRLRRCNEGVEGNGEGEKGGVRKRRGKERETVQGRGTEVTGKEEVVRGKVQCW